MQDKYHKAINNIKRNINLYEFQRFVIHSAQNKIQLFSKIRQLQTLDFPRFNIWRILLQIIPINGSLEDKKASIEVHRKKWLILNEEIKSGTKLNPLKQSPIIAKNPLMKNVVKIESKQIITDSFLSEQIKKDVDRTYQDETFFQDPSILALLTKILFVWCKLNSDISYKQGMNQLLASIIFVYFHQTITHQFQPSNQIAESLAFFNSINFIEADIYIVFDKIMGIQKDMYKQSLDEKIKGEVNPNSKNNSPILQRILQIQDQKLKHVDLELFRVMKLQNVVTKTFLLKWIRCLHTREFGLVNSLFIWDSIFLDYFQSPNSKNRNQFQFIDAMCIAMFIYMRSIVFTRETSNEILKIYQKFPSLQLLYLKQLVNLGWSVCEELRNLANSNIKHTNWYQESQKAKKLGLMQKGGYDETIKSQQIASPIKETIVNKRQQDKVVSQLKNENVQIKSQNPFAQMPKQSSKEEKNIFQNGENHNKSKVQSLLQNHHNQVKRSFSFQYDEISIIVQNLKKSISLNDDIESRALSNKALKILQDKLKK